MSSQPNQPYGAPPPPPNPSQSPFGPPPVAGPGVAPPTPARQLVRDPYSRLGGVASGLGHHYGLDVSLVRILFVVFTLVSGFGLLFYILAWLIVPRAQYWPPAGNTVGIQAVSGRELGLGLALIGLLVGVFFSGGGLSQILVPLLFISGGIWLLTQHPAPANRSAAQPMAAPPTGPGGSGIPRPPTHPGTGVGTDPTAAAADAFAPAPGVPDPGLTTAHQSPPPGQYGDTRVDTVLPPTPNYGTYNSPLVGSAGPPRKRRRGRVLLIVAACLLPVLILMGLVGSLIALVASDAGVTYGIAPLTPSDIPAQIREDTGEVVLDLTRIDPADFGPEPVTSDIMVDVGSIVVIVPEGIEVEVDAETSVGDIQLFDEVSQGGIDIAATRGADDPDIILDLTVDVGSIEVSRGSTSMIEIETRSVRVGGGPDDPADAPALVDDADELPEVPETPEAPETPALTEPPELPETPETPETPEVPEAPGATGGR